MQSHPLDGDGINFEIFKFLSKVSRSAVNSGVRFNMPDTVIFANSCASVWYFFDESSQSVARRPARTLDRRILFDFFAKKTKSERCDIVAQFTSWHEGVLTGTYMTRDDLHDFLFGPRKPYHGILQKFIEPREGRNDLIEVAWSPTMSFAVRRVNAHRIADRNVPPTRRGVTFDGASHDCEELFCNATVRKQMDSVARSLVDYFHEVDHKFNIGRLVAFFKQDVKDTIWFCYTTSIRVVEATSEDKRPTTAVSPEDITPRAALVPLLLTMQALDEEKVARLRKSGQANAVVAPPPRRLRGNFFTPAAACDEDALEKASMRKRERMQDRRVQYEQEQERLFGVLSKLRRDVASLHATLDAGQHVARAKTATPGGARDAASFMNLSPESPGAPTKGQAPHDTSAGQSTAASPLTSGPGSLTTASATYAKSQLFGATMESAMSQSHAAASYMRPPGRPPRRNSRSPRRRKSQLTAVPSVAARAMAVEAAQFAKSAELCRKERHHFALLVGEALADVLYPLGQEIAGSRRSLLHRRASLGGEVDIPAPTWSFEMSRWVWRWLASRRHVFVDYGVLIQCAEEDSELDGLANKDIVAEDDDGGTKAVRDITARQTHLHNPKPSVRCKCRIVPPLPTAGALQRFGNKIQTLIFDDACFYAEQANRCAAAVKTLAAQMLMDDVRAKIAPRRMELDAAGYLYDGPRDPPDLRAIAAVPATQRRHSKGPSVAGDGPLAPPVEQESSTDENAEAGALVGNESGHSQSMHGGSRSPPGASIDTRAMMSPVPLHEASQSSPQEPQHADESQHVANADYSQPMPDVADAGAAQESRTAAEPVPLVAVARNTSTPGVRTPSPPPKTPEPVTTTHEEVPAAAAPLATANGQPMQSEATQEKRERPTQGQNDGIEEEVFADDLNDTAAAPPERHETSAAAFGSDTPMEIAPVLAQHPEADTPRRSSTAATIESQHVQISEGAAQPSSQTPHSEQRALTPNTGDVLTTTAVERASTPTSACIAPVASASEEPRPVFVRGSATPEASEPIDNDAPAAKEVEQDSGVNTVTHAPPPPRPQSQASVGSNFELSTDDAARPPLPDHAAAAQPAARPSRPTTASLRRGSQPGRGAPTPPISGMMRPPSTDSATTDESFYLEDDMAAAAQPAPAPQPEPAAQTPPAAPPIAQVAASAAAPDPFALSPKAPPPAEEKEPSWLDEGF
jgi:hypothetical protein